MDIANTIIEWQLQHGRKDLPWQQNITPYKVLVSEIMLQQTQVKTVIPYFQKWLKYFRYFVQNFIDIIGKNQHPVSVPRSILKTNTLKYLLPSPKLSVKNCG